MRILRPLVAAALAAVATFGLPALADEPAVPVPTGETVSPYRDIAPAKRSDLASQNLLLAADRAGSRIVAVGEYGHIIYSDDGGQSWTQSPGVPVNVTLTAVDFVSETTGWAVGHDDTILKTGDAGETWTLQNGGETSFDVLLTVAFFDETTGIAFGAFNRALRTTDGGETWDEIGPLVDTGAIEDDAHLNAAFLGKGDTVIVASEFGRIYRSPDRGETWALVQTDYAGSFWAGIRLADGSELVAGMRGTVYRSDDDGETWTALPDAGDQSIGGIAQLDDGRVVMAGLSGAVLYSDDGRSFRMMNRPDRRGLQTIVQGAPGTVLVFGEIGVAAQPDTYDAAVASFAAPATN